MRYVAALALTMGWLASGLPAVAQETGQVGGTYAAKGTNRNGSTYTGTVVIKRVGYRYHFSWLIANGDTFKGTGTWEGDSLVVDWGQKDPVIYSAGENGVLHGTWDNGRASETLTPKS